VTEDFGREINVGPPPASLRKRRSLGGLLGFLLLLVVVGSAAAFAWLNYDGLAELTHSAGLTAAGAGSAAEPTVSASDFDAFQQKASTSIQAATDSVTAQQAELKRLSDQVQGLAGQVAALTSRLDQQQTGSGPAPGAVLTPQAAAPVRAAATAAASRPAPTAARKRPTAPKPAGAISVGGAPLPSPTP
jgi:hypothetical protein